MALLMRELMERLGYGALFEKHLTDPRNADRVTHPQAELRTALLLLVQGWATKSDVGLLRNDPALRLAVSSRRGEARCVKRPGANRRAVLAGHAQPRAPEPGAVARNRARLRAVFLDRAERQTVCGRESGAGNHAGPGLAALRGLRPPARERGTATTGCATIRWWCALGAGRLSGRQAAAGQRAHRRWGARVRAPGAAPGQGMGSACGCGSTRISEPDLLDTLEEEGFLYVARLKTNAMLGVLGGSPSHPLSARAPEREGCARGSSCTRPAAGRMRGAWCS